MEHSALSAGIATRRGALATLALSMLLGALGTSIANIALPNLAAAFAAPFHHIQWVVVAYLAALTLTSVFAGRLGDLLGLKRMHLAGLFLFAAASFACGVAPDLPTLIAARALQGAGAAFLMTLTIALVRETSAADRMGRAMGLLGTMSALGTAIGPSVGGFLLPLAGWRGIFLVLVPIGLATLLLAARSLPDSEEKTMAPSFSFAAMRRPELTSNLLANLLVAAVMMTTLVTGPFFLRIGLGLGTELTGLVMTVGPVISIFAGVLSGRAVDAWGARRILVTGLGLMTAGALALGFMPQALGVAGYVLAMIVLTPGYQLFQAANNTAVMSDAPGDLRGVISGVLSLSRNLGLVLGASAMGAVFAFGVGTPDFERATPAALGTGMAMTFGVAGAMMAVALTISLVRSKAGDATQAMPEA